MKIDFNAEIDNQHVIKGAKAKLVGQETQRRAELLSKAYVEQEKLQNSLNKLNEAIQMAEEKADYSRLT